MTHSRKWSDGRGDRIALFPGVVLTVAFVLLAVTGCGQEVSAARERTGTASSISPAATSVALSGYRGEGIPDPFVDEGFHYLGDGHFRTDSGREFFWRHGRFEDPDGSLMEVPESIQETLRAKGLVVPEAQPTTTAGQ